MPSSASSRCISPEAVMRIDPSTFAGLAKALEGRSGMGRHGEPGELWCEDAGSGSSSIVRAIGRRGPSGTVVVAERPAGLTLDVAKEACSARAATDPDGCVVVADQRGIWRAASGIAVLNVDGDGGDLLVETTAI